MKTQQTQNTWCEQQCRSRWMTVQNGSVHTDGSRDTAGNLENKLFYLLKNWQIWFVSLTVRAIAVNNTCRVLENRKENKTLHLVNISYVCKQLLKMCRITSGAYTLPWSWFSCYPGKIPFISPCHFNDFGHLLGCSSSWLRYLLWDRWMFWIKDRKQKLDRTAVNKVTHLWHNKPVYLALN